MERLVTAKLFKNGNSQAVRLPKEFRFEGDEVLISRKGDQVILRPGKRKKSKKHINRNWDDFFFNTPLVDSEFLKDRKDAPPQKRDFF